MPPADNALPRTATRASRRALLKGAAGWAMAMRLGWSGSAMALPHAQSGAALLIAPTDMRAL